MTLEQLGNLGEFFGSIAALITLIYLGIQVRFARMDSRAALIARNEDDRSSPRDSDFVHHVASLRVAAQ
jgi:hypothetical protein